MAAKPLRSKRLNCHLDFAFEGNLRSRSSRCTRSPVQHLPVQRLHHRRIAVLVGVRERVAPRRNRATQLLPLGGVEPRRVADAVERLRLRELLVDERDDMAPRRERPREVPCCGRRRMKNIRRDEVDYLPEDRVYCFRCFWWCLFLHNPVGYRITPPVATLDIHPIANPVSEWDANVLCLLVDA